jgi:hypothetical protein
MPIYTIRLDGKTYDLQGDHPPSEAEARAAISSMSAASTAPPAAPPATDARTRPLLTGLTDAGAARQFSDPSAMNDLNAAKDRAASVGLWGGAAAMGGLATAGTPLAGAIGGAVRGVAEATPYIAAYRGMTAAGVPPEIAGALAGAAGLKSFMGGKGAPKTEAPPPRMLRVGGTVVDRYLPNQSAAPQGGDPNAAAMPLPAVIERYLANSSAASHAGDAEAPGAVAPRSPLSQTLQPSPNAFVNLDRPTESGRSWHSGAADEAEKASAASLHRYDSEMDTGYRAKTADARAAIKADPLSVRDALIALLNGTIGRQ